MGVDILTGGTRYVNGADVSFELAQSQPAGDLLPLHVQVCAYDESGRPVSQMVELDLASESVDVNARKVPVRLDIAQDVDSGQLVVVRVMGRFGNTNKYQEVVSAQYVVRRSFGMDF